MYTLLFIFLLSNIWDYGNLGIELWRLWVA